MKGGAGGGDTGRIHAGQVLNLQWKRYLSGAEHHEVVSPHKPDTRAGAREVSGGKEGRRLQ